MESSLATPIETAASAVDKAQERFDRVWTSTLAPGLIQMAANDLLAAVNHFADVKRETSGGAS